MRKPTAAAILAVLATAACMDEGTGQITHTAHRLTGTEQATVQAGLQQILGQPVVLSGLQASHVLATGNQAVCGYVAPAGSTPAMFGGTLNKGVFTLFPASGKGQDPERIATVRAFCKVQQITI